MLDPDVVVRTIAADLEMSRGKRMEQAVPAIAECLKAQSPKLLHAPGNHTILSAWRAIEKAGFNGAFVPKLTNPLAKQSNSWRRQWRRNREFRSAFKRADLILTLSLDGSRQVSALSRRLGARTKVVQNPYVSDAMFRRAAERKPANPQVILSLGRLTEQKNHAMLIKAAARLRHRDWRLRIFGSGPEEIALRSLADELGIADRLELPGFIADPVPEYLSAAVMALSSRWEGLPATLIEAIACGCPVVSTASSPGLVEFLRSVGAREPVAVDDEKTFSEMLEEALGGRLPALSPNAVLPYGIEASCDQHAALFSELIEAHTAGR